MRVQFVCDRVFQHLRILIYELGYTFQAGHINISQYSIIETYTFPVASKSVTALNQISLRSTYCITGL
jgi:hypothetical protein